MSEILGQQLSLWRGSRLQGNAILRGSTHCCCLTPCSVFQAASATGPLCVGVWKQVGQRTFRLHHVGWNFDINGNSLGSFTLDETNTVSRNGLTYKGTFDLKFYDVDGNLIAEVTGTQKATRISVS
jgi:hypothetical protein